MCDCDRQREVIKEIKSIDNALKQAKIDFLQRDSTIVLAFNVVVIYGYYLRLYLSKLFFSRQKYIFLLFKIKNALLECKKERYKKIVLGKQIRVLKAAKKLGQ
ncbi:hypothetical protein LS72_005040 [Helicobacter apodemus]|uniref:Uncharacterized protein n=1 Tax=Helicobacter apodemus TaxID=135569 RepID=A0A4U8UH92_9HELI|nr:hypothetical protein [Helicobacter apodemus]TLE15926.1 hypothetical protein LS72_005040 [Helicobacter apodemus]